MVDTSEVVVSKMDVVVDGCSVVGKKSNFVI